MNVPINKFQSIEAANERIRELEAMVDYLRSRELSAPNNEIAEIFHLINIGAPIDEQLLEHSFYSILTSPHIRARDFQLGTLLSGLMVRGPTAKEIACLIRTALRVDGITRIKTALPKGEKLICVAGSGKKGQKTFNISTPSCLVACAAGAYIAKPCSAATSSITGSKDFLLLVGANLNGTEEMVDVMVGTGFGAYSIEAMVPRFDSVYGGRVYSPTPLSFALPAMINPVVCDSVFYGVSHPDISLALDVFSELGYKDAMVVTSSDDETFFLDELSPLRYNHFGLMENQVIGKKVRLFAESITSKPPARPMDLRQGRSVGENVRVAVNALRNKETGPIRDVVALNAGALLMLSGKAASLNDGYKLAIETLENGRAFERLLMFIDATHGKREMLDPFLKDSR